MFTRILFLALIVIAYAFGQLPTAITTTFTSNYSFPPTGLSSSETAQVNVLNTAAASTNTGAAAPACTGSITFTNSAGTTIGSVSFTTTDHQIFSTPLTFGKLGTTGARGEFVASVQLTSTFPATAPCSLMFSLETFDSGSGVTHVFLSNSATSAVVGGGRLPIVLPL